MRVTLDAPAAPQTRDVPESSSLTITTPLLLLTHCRNDTTDHNAIRDIYFANRTRAAVVLLLGNMRQLVGLDVLLQIVLSAPLDAAVPVVEALASLPFASAQYAPRLAPKGILSAARQGPVPLRWALARWKLLLRDATMAASNSSSTIAAQPGAMATSLASTAPLTSAFRRVRRSALLLRRAIAEIAFRSFEMQPSIGRRENAIGSLRTHVDVAETTLLLPANEEAYPDGSFTVGGAAVAAVAHAANNSTHSSIQSGISVIADIAPWSVVASCAATVALASTAFNQHGAHNRDSRVPYGFGDPQPAGAAINTVIRPTDACPLLPAAWRAAAVGALPKTVEAALRSAGVAASETGARQHQLRIALVSTDDVGALLARVAQAVGIPLSRLPGSLYQHALPHVPPAPRQLPYVAAFPASVDARLTRSPGHTDDFSLKSKFNLHHTPLANFLRKSGANAFFGSLGSPFSGIELRSDASTSSAADNTYNAQSQYHADGARHGLYEAVAVSIGATKRRNNPGWHPWLPLATCPGVAAGGRRRRLVPVSASTREGFLAWRGGAEQSLQDALLASPLAPTATALSLSTTQYDDTRREHRTPVAPDALNRGRHSAVVNACAGDSTKDAVVAFVDAIAAADGYGASFVPWDVPARFSSASYVESVAPAPTGPALRVLVASEAISPAAAVAEWTLDADCAPGPRQYPAGPHLLDGRVNVDATLRPGSSLLGVPTGELLLDAPLQAMLFNVLRTVGAAAVSTARTAAAVAIMRLMSHSLPPSPLVLLMLADPARIDWHRVVGTRSNSASASSTDPAVSVSGPAASTSSSTAMIDVEVAPLALGPSVSVADATDVNIASERSYVDAAGGNNISDTDSETDVAQSTSTAPLPVNVPKAASDLVFPGLFYGGSLASVYLLQSVIAYVRPPLTPSFYMANIGPAQWARRFITAGGLDAVLAAVLAPTVAAAAADGPDPAAEGDASCAPPTVALMIRAACLHIVACILSMPPRYDISPQSVRAAAAAAMRPAATAAHAEEDAVTGVDASVDLPRAAGDAEAAQAVSEPLPPLEVPSMTQPVTSTARVELEDSDDQIVLVAAVMARLAALRIHDTDVTAACGSAAAAVPAFPAFVAALWRIIGGDSAAIDAPSNHVHVNVARDATLLQLASTSIDDVDIAATERHDQGGAAVADAMEAPRAAAAVRLWVLESNARASASLRSDGESVLRVLLHETLQRPDIESLAGDALLSQSSASSTVVVDGADVTRHNSGEDAAANTFVDSTDVAMAAADVPTTARAVPRLSAAAVRLSTSLSFESAMDDARVRFVVQLMTSTSGPSAASVHATVVDSLSHMLARSPVVALRVLTVTNDEFEGVVTEHFERSADDVMMASETTMPQQRTVTAPRDLTDTLIDDLMRCLCAAVEAVRVANVMSMGAACDGVVWPPEHQPQRDATDQCLRAAKLALRAAAVCARLAPDEASDQQRAVSDLDSAANVALGGLLPFRRPAPAPQRIIDLLTHLLRVVRAAVIVPSRLATAAVVTGSPRTMPLQAGAPATQVEVMHAPFATTLFLPDVETTEAIANVFGEQCLLRRGQPLLGDSSSVRSDDMQRAPSHARAVRSDAFASAAGDASAGASPRDDAWSLVVAITAPLAWVSAWEGGGALRAGDIRRGPLLPADSAFISIAANAPPPLAHRGPEIEARLRVLGRLIGLASASMMLAAYSPPPPQRAASALRYLRVDDDDPSSALQWQPWSATAGAQPLLSLPAECTPCTRVRHVPCDSSVLAAIATSIAPQVSALRSAAWTAVNDFSTVAADARVYLGVSASASTIAAIASCDDAVQRAKRWLETRGDLWAADAVRATGTPGDQKLTSAAALVDALATGGWIASRMTSDAQFIVRSAISGAAHFSSQLQSGDDGLFVAAAVSADPQPSNDVHARRATAEGSEDCTMTNCDAAAGEATEVVGRDASLAESALQLLREARDNAVVTASRAAALQWLTPERTHAAGADVEIPNRLTTLSCIRALVRLCDSAPEADDDVSRGDADAPIDARLAGVDEITGGAYIVADTALGRAIERLIGGDDALTSARSPHRYLVEGGSASVAAAYAKSIVAPRAVAGSVAAQLCARSSDAPFVGLENPSALCYQNSLLQQLHAIPSLRHLLLASPDGAAIDAALISRNGMRDRFEAQYRGLRSALTETIARLCTSPAQCVSGAPFLAAIRDPAFFPLGSSAESQNDANELFNLLVDRAGRVFPLAALIDAVAARRQTNAARGAPSAAEPFHSSASGTAADAFTATFGFTVLQQIIGTGAPCPHYRARETAAMCLTLDLPAPAAGASAADVAAAPLPTLADSLKAFVAGELLSGDNAYACDECGIKVPAIKRSALASASLPPVLAISLNRFAFDFSTDPPTRIKLRSGLVFPDEVDLAPYTAEGIAAAEQRDAAASASVPGASSLASPTEASPKSSSSTVANALANVPGANTTAPSTRYVLRGVLCHRGTSSSGHYFSYIRPRARDTAPADGTGLAAIADELSALRTVEASASAEAEAVSSAAATLGASSDADRGTASLSSPLTGSILGPAARAATAAAYVSALRARIATLTALLELHDGGVAAPMTQSARGAGAASDMEGWWEFNDSVVSRVDTSQLAAVKARDWFGGSYTLPQHPSGKAPAAATADVDWSTTETDDDGLDWGGNASPQPAAQHARAKPGIGQRVTTAYMLFYDRVVRPPPSTVAGTASRASGTAPAASTSVSALRASVIQPRDILLPADACRALTAERAQSALLLRALDAPLLAFFSRAAEATARSHALLLAGAPSDGPLQVTELARQPLHALSRAAALLGIDAALRALLGAALRRESGVAFAPVAPGNACDADGERSPPGFTDAAASSAEALVRAIINGVCSGDATAMGIAASNSGNAPMRGGSGDQVCLAAVEAVVRVLVYPGIPAYSDLVAGAANVTYAANGRIRGFDATTELRESLPLLRLAASGDNGAFSAVASMQLRRLMHGVLVALATVAWDAVEPGLSRAATAAPGTSTVSSTAVARWLAAYADLPEPLLLQRRRALHSGDSARRAADGDVSVINVTTSEDDDELDLQLPTAAAGAAGGVHEAELPVRPWLRRYSREQRALRAADTLVRAVVPIASSRLSSPSCVAAVDWAVWCASELPAAHPLLPWLLARNHGPELALASLRAAESHVFNAAGGESLRRSWASLDSLVGVYSPTAMWPPAAFSAADTGATGAAAGDVAGAAAMGFSPLLGFAVGSVTNDFLWRNAIATAKYCAMPPPPRGSAAAVGDGISRQQQPQPLPFAAPPSTGQGIAPNAESSTQAVGTAEDTQPPIGAAASCPPLLPPAPAAIAAFIWDIRFATAHVMTSLARGTECLRAALPLWARAASASTHFAALIAAATADMLPRHALPPQHALELIESVADIVLPPRPPAVPATGSNDRAAPGGPPTPTHVAASALLYSVDERPGELVGLSDDLVRAPLYVAGQLPHKRDMAPFALPELVIGSAVDAMARPCRRHAGISCNQLSLRLCGAAGLIAPSSLVRLQECGDGTARERIMHAGVPRTRLPNGLSPADVRAVLRRVGVTPWVEWETAPIAQQSVCRSAAAPAVPVIEWLPVQLPARSGAAAASPRGSSSGGAAAGATATSDSAATSAAASSLPAGASAVAAWLGRVRGGGARLPPVRPPTHLVGSSGVDRLLRSGLVSRLLDLASLACAAAGVDLYCPVPPAGAAAPPLPILHTTLKASLARLSTNASHEVVDSHMHVWRATFRAIASIRRRWPGSAASNGAVSWGPLAGDHPADAQWIRLPTFLPHAPTLGLAARLAWDRTQSLFAGWGMAINAGLWRDAYEEVLAAGHAMFGQPVPMRHYNYTQVVVAPTPVAGDADRDDFAAHQADGRVATSADDAADGGGDTIADPSSSHKRERNSATRHTTRPLRPRLETRAYVDPILALLCGADASDTAAPPVDSASTSTGASGRRGTSTAAGASDSRSGAAFPATGALSPGKRHRDGTATSVGPDADNADSGAGGAHIGVDAGVDRPPPLHAGAVGPRHTKRLKSLPPSGQAARPPSAGRAMQARQRPEQSIADVDTDGEARHPDADDGGLIEGSSDVERVHISSPTEGDVDSVGENPSSYDRNDEKTDGYDALQGDDLRLLRRPHPSRVLDNEDVQLDGRWNSGLPLQPMHSEESIALALDMIVYGDIASNHVVLARENFPDDLELGPVQRLSVILQAVNAARADRRESPILGDDQLPRALAAIYHAAAMLRAEDLAIERYGVQDDESSWRMCVDSMVTDLLPTGGFAWHDCEHEEWILRALTLACSERIALQEELRNPYRGRGDAAQQRRTIELQARKQQRQQHRQQQQQQSPPARTGVPAGAPRPSVGGKEPRFAPPPLKPPAQRGKQLFESDYVDDNFDPKDIPLGSSECSTQRSGWNSEESGFFHDD